MKHLEMKNIKKSIHDNTLFEIENIVVNAGEKVGIIGRNGSGKSTLLKMIAGEDAAYEGTIYTIENIVYVPQIKNESTESGGEQMKNYLMEAFNRQPELLILDEPTANLDVDNLEWFLNAMNEFPNTLILVSHDRHILDKTVSKLIYFENNEAKVFVGNYNDYERFKNSQLQHQKAEFKEYQDTVRRLNKEAEKRSQHAKGFKKRKKNVSTSEYKVRSRMGSYDSQEKAIAKSSKVLEKRIEQMDVVNKPQEEKNFKFKAVGLLKNDGKTLINLEHNEVAVDNKFLFTVNQFKLIQGEHIALTGANQSGKTTFIRKLITQEMNGYFAENMKIGYFAQDYSNLDFQKTILENVMKDTLQDIHIVRNLLAALGFDINKVNEKPEVLSGGERVRLSLAKTLVGDYHLLLLDEPTNFLDIETLQSVEHFLKDYPGTFILISHDRTFIDHTVQRKYEIKDKQLLSETYQQEFSGSKDTQRQLLEFRLNQLMLDPDADMERILQLKKQIEKLR